jgi:hypothetical protein
LATGGKQLFGNQDDEWRRPGAAACEPGVLMDGDHGIDACLHQELCCIKK